MCGPLLLCCSYVVHMQISKWWWQRQRYVTMLPALWDASCTQGHNAIIGPEFYHWLKHSHHGKLARRLPGPDTTVFKVHPAAKSLHLSPPSPPGGDSMAVQPGALVPPDNSPGWSWYDVQVALPASQVVQAMRAVHQHALVYVDHPVMVVSEVTTGTEAPPSDIAISEINAKLNASNCKALWVSLETASWWPLYSCGFAT